MANVGKVFEQNFKKSVPEHIFTYRPPDAAQSFNMNSNLRFSAKSPCDLFMFDGEILFTLELKTFQGSCSFERTKEDKGIIHYYQVETLREFYKFINVEAGFVLDFRSSDNTYYLPIQEYDKLIDAVTKKSFNEKDLLTFCSPVLLEKKKLKVNYRYDVQKMIDDVKEKNYV